MSLRAKFSIGQRFMDRGKCPRLCVVTDILTTTNSAGDVVRIRYVADHVLMGQTVTDHDVTETRIAMGAVND